MPGPLSKQQLLATIRRERDALDSAIARVSEARRTEETLEGGRSVKDVLAHVSAWEKICIALVRNNQPLQAPTPGETGQASTDTINQRVYEDSRRKSLDEVRAESERSYADLLALVEALPGDALDAKVGEGQEGAEASPQVGGLIRGNSDEHYREHIEQIEAWLRERPT